MNQFTNRIRIIQIEYGGSDGADAGGDTQAIRHLDDGAAHQVRGYYHCSDSNAITTHGLPGLRARTVADRILAGVEVNHTSTNSRRTQTLPFGPLARLMADRVLAGVEVMHTTITHVSNAIPCMLPPRERWRPLPCNLS